MKLLLENWHNFIEEGKKTKEEEEFKPHMMYDPETGEAEKTKTYDRHLKLKNMGWGHDKPKVDEKKNKEGKEQGNKIGIRHHPSLVVGMLFWLFLPAHGAASG